MFDILKTRFKQGNRTIGFPDAKPMLTDRFRGIPVLQTNNCPSGCRACIEACPTGALQIGANKIELDLGRCLFCTDCEGKCPEHLISFSKDYRLSTRNRDDLMVSDKPFRFEDLVDKKIRQVFGRSLKLRQVSAGGCNACEADVNVLNTVVFDLARFGIQFVASPRHADGLLITGPVTENMAFALQKTYEAIPSPKIVIAVGACAISGGPFINHPEVKNGAEKILPVDLFIPGCPPHPITILDGLLRLIGRIENRKSVEHMPR